MDLTSIFGMVFGVICILIGQALEGGNVNQLIQITAAFIVFGGTAGAVILSFPGADLLNSILFMQKVFFNVGGDHKKLIAQLIDYAQRARKEGIIVLEKEAQQTKDPMMKLGLEAVSDGSDPVLVRDLMETQLEQIEGQVTRASKVWESAGGYTPTVGIIGAVLGLIQVMENLDNPEMLGPGIAVAFVATIYGVGAANLYFIPLSSKIKLKAHSEIIAKQIIIEGILSIQAGESPTLIERKLNAFLI